MRPTDKIPVMATSADTPETEYSVLAAIFKLYTENERADSVSNVYVVSLNMSRSVIRNIKLRLYGTAFSESTLLPTQNTTSKYTVHR